MYSAILTVVILAAIFGPGPVRADTPNPAPENSADIPSAFSSADIPTTSSFITIDGNQFMLRGQEFRGIGMCNYPFSFGNLDYVTRTTRRAKAAGVTLIRCCLTFDNDFAKWNDEQLWLKTDWLLKVCADENMHVLIDLSGFRSPITEGLNEDCWAASSYPYWDDLVDFVTARVNPFTGKAYRDDPVIFQWLISGEPVPYGFTGDIHNDSRDVNVIEDLLLHVAARLRTQDPNHLISAGGLLHMSVPLDRHGRPYWQTLWSSPNIDCGAIHIYLSDYTQLPGGSWSNLATYKGFCDQIGKPFVLEEWGIDIYTNSLSVAEPYYRFGFDQAFTNDIPITINWDWAPSGGYSVFPGHADTLLAIVSENAPRWGYDGPIFTYQDPPIAGTTLWDFESGVDGFSSTGYGGNAGAPSVSTAHASSGSQSLRVPVSFTSTVWNFAGIVRDVSPRLDGSATPKIACDVWVPPGIRGYSVKFLVYNDFSGWTAYAQSGGVRNNWLLPGWNTVYANLDSPYAMDWTPFPTRFDRIVRVTLEIHHDYGAPVFAGDFYVDNFRIGDFESPPPLPSGWIAY